MTTTVFRIAFGLHGGSPTGTPAKCSIIGLTSFRRAVVLPLSLVGNGAGVSARAARYWMGARPSKARLDGLDSEQQAAGRVSRADHLAALRKVCGDWRTLLHADPAHGRRVLRDLRIDRVVVRRDQHGRWSYKLVGDLSKLAGFDGNFYAVTDEGLASWLDEPEPIVQEDQDSCPRGDSNTRHAV